MLTQNIHAFKVMYNYIIIHTVCAEQLQEVILGKIVRLLSSEMDGETVGFQSGFEDV